MKKITLISELGARFGISILPNSSYRRKLSSLQEKWRNSASRILVGELHNFFLRIQAVLQKPNPKYGLRIPAPPMGLDESFSLNHRFALACNDHIQRQRSDYRWLGILDSEIMGLSYQAGAEWALRNQGSLMNSEDSRES
jgi:hypothetical protein